MKLETKSKRIFKNAYKDITKNTKYDYYLEPRYDARQSFYKKALVIETKKRIYLKSYSTIVACIEDNMAFVDGWYSQTTTRHIKDFLKQNDFFIKEKKYIYEK